MIIQAYIKGIMGKSQIDSTIIVIIQAYIKGVMENNLTDSTIIVIIH